MQPITLPYYGELTKSVRWFPFLESLSHGINLPSRGIGEKHHGLVDGMSRPASSVFVIHVLLVSSPINKSDFYLRSTYLLSH